MMQFKKFSAVCALFSEAEKKEMGKDRNSW